MERALSGGGRKGVAKMFDITEHYNNLADSGFGMI
jgi:hypothetical protein